MTRIKSPTPLPEDPESPLVMAMLVPAPYKAPTKKPKKTKGKGAGDSPRPAGKKPKDLHILSSDEAEEDDEKEEEEEEMPPAQGRGKRGVVADAGTAAPRRKLNLGASSSSSEHSYVMKPREKPLPET